MRAKSRLAPETWRLPARLGLGRLEWKELRWLILGLATCALLWIFLVLAGEIADGETQAFDIMILKALRSPDDLSRPIGPAWLEDAGSRVCYRLLRPSSLPVVVGHADWESQNVRWVNTRLHVVHDWDSVVGEREATIAGAASAVFSATGAPNTSASVEQSEAFLKAYAETRGHPWTSEERELAWAAGLWVRVFNAKKATVRPGGETPSPSRLRLEAEVSERLRRAGA